MRSNVVVLVLVALLMFSGCAVLQSSKQPQPVYSNVPDKEAGALGYFLPKGMLRIKYDGNNFHVETTYIPDPNYFYTLKYKANACSADDIKISLTKNGLLKSIDVTAEDKIVEIAKKLIDIGKEVAKATVIPVPFALPELKPLDVIVDPDIFIYGDDYNKARRSNLENKLARYGIKLDLTRQDIAAKTSVTQGPQCQKGVYYRPLVPYELTLTSEKDGKILFEQTELVFLPNGAPILALDVSRAAFVKKVTKVTFEDGILTELYVNKPSEVLAFLEIPFYLVQSIVALPTELIQVKIKYSTSQTSLYEQQLKELQALKALQEEKQKKPDAGVPGSGEPPSLSPTPGSTKIRQSDAQTKLFKQQLKELQALKALQEEKQKKPGTQAPAKPQEDPGGDPIGK